MADENSPSDGNSNGKEMVGDRKYFQVTLDFKLKEKPDWLDKFRKKFDKPYEYHITLKYPTTISPELVHELKNQLADISSSTQKPIELSFDEYFFNQLNTGGLIMVKAKPNELLETLQRKVVNRLSGYGEPAKPHYVKFENNFLPHITIARHLTPEQFEEAKTKLKTPILCKASVTEITLSVVNDVSQDEVIDPQNSSKYMLGKKS